jgi:hypothetical protein
MTGLSPTLNEWRRLYQAAIRVKEIAPWEWMTETDVFGVQNPETDEIGFVSVMGALGEHLSLALYLGSEGLYSFWGFQQLGDSAPPEAIFGMLHLQASFEDRNTLSKKDRDVIKELGFKFRGRQAWPMFRSYRPGFFPWYLEAAEVRFLTYALEQVTEVTLHFKEDPAMLETDDDEGYLVRVPREKKGALAWEDRIEIVSPPDPEPISIPMDLNVLEEVKRLPRSRHALEMDFFMVPVQVSEERGARPYFPHMLLVVESDSGFVFCSELLSPEPDLEAMWGEIPVTVVHQLARIGVVPGQIRVRSSLLAQLLHILVEDLEFQVEMARSLRRLDEAKGFLLERFI